MAVKNQNQFDSAERAAAKLVMITGTGCRIANAIDMKAECGRPRVGWRYGEKKNVTCPNCLEGTQYDDVVVPPALPADNAELPILDMEAFDAG